jgi:putative flippase GtrA
MHNKNKLLDTIIQFIKYALIGGMNFLINLGVMNLLMYMTNTYKGNKLFLFQVISFFVYTTNGFFMNKKFTFKLNTHRNPYLQYIAVMGPAALCSAFLIRTLTLYNIFNLSPKLWANIIILFSSITIGTIGFLINKFFVFEKNQK